MLRKIELLSTSKALFLCAPTALKTKYCKRCVYCIVVLCVRVKEGPGYPLVSHRGRGEGERGNNGDYVRDALALEHREGRDQCRHHN